MHNIVLTIAYDGTRYLGWQKTTTGLTIEAVLEQALRQILQSDLSLQAASRTDAGVHATGQVANFLISKEVKFFSQQKCLAGSINWQDSLQRLQRSLNALLPKDIVVLNVEDKPLSFHPTLYCTEKEYRYFICEGSFQLPHYRLYSWHVHNPLDLDLIKQAIPVFIGKKDFSTFCNVKKNEVYEHHIREITYLDCEKLDGNRLCFSIKGQAFLYKMVRNIVGTLIDIGRKKICLSNLQEIIERKSRPEAGITAPAHGLFLHHITFQKNY